MFQNFVGVCWTAFGPAHRRGVLLVFMLVLVSFLDGLFHLGDDGSSRTAAERDAPATEVPPESLVLLVSP